MKKSHKKLLWHLLFWGFVIGGGLWVAFAPTHHGHHRHYATSSVRVAVKHPPLPKPPPPPPQPAVAMPDTPAAPPVGDERAQPYPQTTVPVIPESAKPLPPGRKPMIAIVIDDMGLDLKDSRRAVTLPDYVTLSYMPYAIHLKEQTTDALQQGHELLLHMPMQPVGHDDPGPGALLTSLAPDEIDRRFKTALASFSGFDGVNNHMGSKFTAYRKGMEIVISDLKERGLFFLDSRTTPKTVGQKIAREDGVPTIARNVFLDDDISSEAVTHQLEQAERLARHRGYAVAIGHPHAVTLQVLEAWLPEAEKRGIRFVPLHKLVAEGY